MQKQTKDINRVVIVGGGFAGVKAALELSNSEVFEITLISNDKDFQYHASLYRNVVGGSRVQTLIALDEIFHDKGIKLVRATATKINRKDKVLLTSDGRRFKYDTLVLAIGSVTNYFGIKGLKENSFGIKNYREASKLKDHLHSQLVAKGKPDFNYVVIGGGASGVELAGALPSYIKFLLKQHGIKHRAVHISLVEASSRIMNSSPKDISWSITRRLRRLGVHMMLNKTVNGANHKNLFIDDKPIKSSSIIWTAGITNHPFFTKNNFLLGRRNLVKVNEYLEAEPDIFVLGDNADTPYSGMAQTALRDADAVAKNIIRQYQNKPLVAYKPKKPVYITPVGPHWAAVSWGQLRIYGALGWVIRRAADWLAYREVEPWWKANRQWLAAGEKEESCSRCRESNT